MPNRIAFGGEVEQQFIIAFDLNMAGVLDAVRAIPGRRFNRDSKVWTAPWSAAPLVRLVAERYAFDVTPEAQVIFDATAKIAAPPLLFTRRIRLVNDRIEVLFDYDAGLVAEARTLPGRKFDQTTKMWYFPVGSADVVVPGLKSALTVFAERNTFTMDSAVIDRLNDLEAMSRQVIASSRALSSNIVVSGLTGELRPFQKAGVQYALQAKSLIIGDDVGLGKSVEALATIEAANALPALIVTTASMKLTWAGSQKIGVVSEIDKWLPNRSYVVLDGTGWLAAKGHSISLNQFDYVILNYDLQDKWMPELVTIPFKAVVLDESHYIKTKKAKRSLAAKQLLSLPSVQYKIALSATSVLNRPSELINQLDAIGRLKDFGGFWAFANRYCGAYRDTFGLNISDATNLEELHERLRATCYIRREKSEVLAELPAIENTMVPIDIDNRAEYAKAEDDVITWLGEQAERRAALLGLTAQERRDARRSAEAKAARAEVLVRIEALSQIVARGKLAGANAWLQDFFDGSTDKIIVFAKHREIVEALAKEWYCPVIYGGMSDKQRQAVKDDFQLNPKTRMLVANIISAGEGLTLTAAKSVAFIEQEWTPARHTQAIGRAYGRLNDAHGVNVYWLLARNTIDEDRAELLSLKRKVVDTTLTGQGDEAVQMSILDALTQKLVARYRGH